MTDTNVTDSMPADGAAIVAAALVSAGAGIGAYLLLRDPDRREACFRVLQELGVPQALRTAFATVLVNAAQSVRGNDDNGNLRLAAS